MNDIPFLLAMVARSYVEKSADNGAGSPRRQRDTRRLAWRATTASGLHRLADWLEPTGRRPATTR